MAIDMLVILFLFGALFIIWAISLGMIILFLEMMIKQVFWFSRGVIRLGKYAYMRIRGKSEQTAYQSAVNNDKYI